MTKNVEKGRSFAWAFRRMKEAREAGYYIEAAAVAESIIADRLYSVLVARGETFKLGKDGHPTLGALIGGVAKYLDGTEGFTVDQLRAFQNARNMAIHQVAKSQPGDPTVPIEEFLSKAEEAASDGKRLARKIVEWYRRGLPPEMKAAKRKRTK